MLRLKPIAVMAMGSRKQMRSIKHYAVFYIWTPELTQRPWLWFICSKCTQTAKWVLTSKFLPIESAVYLSCQCWVRNIHFLYSGGSCKTLWRDSETNELMSQWSSLLTELLRISRSFLFITSAVFAFVSCCYPLLAAVRHWSSQH